MTTTHSTFPKTLPSATDMRRIRRQAEEMRAETLRNALRTLTTALSGFGRAPSLRLAMRLGERRA